MTRFISGPDNYRESRDYLHCADGEPLGSVNEQAYLRYAHVHAVNAQTSAIVMLSGIIADAANIRAYELDAWAEVIPPSLLKECKSKELRRPECSERHTDDCTYADPPEEPKHELLPIGTRVLVSDLVWNEDTKVPERTNPEPGKIVGYDLNRTKYRWRREWNWEGNRYSEHDQWAFADNRVQVHPDGPECSPAPELVKQNPTGPRIYVQNRRGKQGHIVETGTRDDVISARVQWYTPGARPVWVPLSNLEIILSSEVDRCPNGQTLDECGSGENQCELCLQAEDEEGDEIERSMGLR